MTVRSTRQPVGSLSGGQRQSVAVARAIMQLADSLVDYVRMWWARVRAGESGALPALVGLAVIVIVIYFDIRSSAFLSAGNLVNLMTQASQPLGSIANRVPRPN